ncbi:MAG TPA: HAMP domain-containing sensor histidine kinase [Spirochaetia bacterium]|nr:HAMP domain-containing sensor histidine kinase [Spirochaetia bacterium]
MHLRHPSISLFTERASQYWTWPVAAAAILASPWLASLYQPLYNNVEELVERSITSGDSGLLILAAAIFVFLRSLSMITFFWGGLVLGVKLPLRGNRPWAQELLLPVVIAAVAFVFISEPTGVPWNYMAPLFILAVAVVLLPDLLRHYIVLPTVVLVQLFLAFLWLDLAPALARFGFGRGDLPSSIRMAAESLHDQRILDLVSIFWFAAFFISAISVVLLTSVSMNRMNIIRENQRRQVELECLRAQAAETRVEKEMLTLVHDLKTPLMTIQGLSSLVTMQVRDEKIGEYADRISKSVDRVSEMISEILHGNVRKMVTVDQLFDYVRAHVLLDAKDPTTVTFTCSADVPGLHVNLIRMARAFINLIENALVAVAGQEGGVIAVQALLAGNDQVVLKVSDNGQGVEDYYLTQVWDYGYSTRDGSSGLGLAFVRQVVESNGGTIEFISRPKQGTTVVLSFPGVGKHDQNPDH